MTAQRRTLAGAVAFGLTLLGLALQFIIRAVMIGALGAGAEYDSFLVAQIPAVLLATVGFQAMASVLVPRLSAFIAEGRVAEAHALYRRLLLASFVVCVPVVAGTVGFGWASTNASHALLMLEVLLGWGLLSGISIVQRQVLVFLGSFTAPTVFALAPGVAMLAVAATPLRGTVEAYVAAGLAGNALCAALGAVAVSRTWDRQYPGTRGAAAQLPISELRPVALGAVPIVLASFNAQVASTVQQGLAAWWAAGGLSMLSAAIAVARLPHTLGDNVAMATGYRALVSAAAEVNARPTAETRQRLADVFSQQLRAQSLVVLPCAVMAATQSRAIVEFLFQRGRFGPEEAAATAAILMLAPLGAPGILLQSVQVQTLVSLGKASLALRYEVFLTVLSCLSIAALLPVLGLPGLVLGLGLSTVGISLLIFRALTRLGVGVQWHLLADALGRPLTAAALAAASSVVITSGLMEALNLTGALPRLFVSGTIVVLVYLAASHGSLPGRESAPATHPVSG